MSSKRPTLTTIEKKIDALSKSVGTKISALTEVVENLAISTKKQFDNVDRRFDAVEERLDTLEKTSTRIENGLHNRLERAEDNIAILKTHAGIR